MSPAELDLMLQGLFIYQRPDGSTYRSHDYKLRDYGVACVGRTGPLTDDQWRDYFAIAAAARQGGDAKLAPAESPQSGGDKPHRPNAVTQHQSGDRHGR